MNTICILRLSAIGDVTHVIPVVLSLQEQLPNVKITWVIGKIEAKLIGDLPVSNSSFLTRRPGEQATRSFAGK